MEELYYKIKHHELSPRIAKFSKVPFEQYLSDFRKIFDDEKAKSSLYGLSDNEIKRLYDSIELPVRATRGSCGYDFKCPFNFILNRGETILIPTGISCEVMYGWGLFILPRSGHGFKYRVQLDNTVGVIDSDYCESKNYGHIVVKLSCDSFDNHKFLKVSNGEGIAQGVFIRYGLTVDDDVHTLRDGGFGSTNLKNRFKTICMNSDGKVDYENSLCNTCECSYEGCNAKDSDYLATQHQTVYACNKYRKLTMESEG